MSYLNFPLQQNLNDILLTSPQAKSNTETDESLALSTDTSHQDFDKTYEQMALSVTSSSIQSNTEINESLVPVSTDTSHQDSAKMQEHMALLDLLQKDSATHIAINSGSWFNSNTWKNGIIPDNNADVLIKEGVEVVYDNISNASLHGVRVDGTLQFAHDTDTKMVIDTFIVAPKGTLEIGTQSQPIQSDKTVEIIIADNGAIDLDWDPTQLSRGLVSHGKVTMHGMKKTTHLKLERDAMAGDTELLLDNVPQNWQIGDRIVLTGTHHLPRKTSSSSSQYTATQDEELKIVEIDGKRIILDRPLQYDHDTPRDDLKASVANYSRNISFKTENFEEIPNNQRGHVMFMHSNDVDVRYAEFFELGRTDKSKALDDFELKGGRTSERILDADGNTIPGDKTNIRGRYSFHFHRTGIGENDNPAVAIGNAVWGSPGWGYVHHDSHAVMNDNAAYDVYGSAFVSETGNETGEWKNNIAINGQGLLRNIKHGSFNQDVGMQGNGFWYQSRMIENGGNIAAGMSGMGVACFHRGVDTLDPLTKNLSNPEIALYQSTVSDEIPPIALFAENEVFASGKALHIAKLDPNQGHNLRNLITDFSGWEVQNGMQIEYTRHYTLKDITLIASEETAKPDTIGVHIDNRTEDMLVADFLVDGFDTGISLVDSKDNGNFIFMNANLANNKTNLISNVTSTSDFVTSDIVRQRELVLETDADKIFRAGSKLTIQGEKIDSLGRTEYMIGGDRILFEDSNIANRLKNGYYTLENGMPILTVEVFVSDRLTGAFKEAALPVRLDGIDMSDLNYLGVYDPSANADGASEDLIVKQIISKHDKVIVGTSSIDEFALSADRIGHNAAIYGFENEKDKLLISSSENYTLSDTTIELGNGNEEGTAIAFSNDKTISLIGITAEKLLDDIVSTADI